MGSPNSSVPMDSTVRSDVSTHFNRKRYTVNDLVFIPIEKPTCQECKGTGKITLFTGIVDCKACKVEPAELPDWKPDVPQRYVQMVGRATRRQGMSVREFYRALFGGE